MQNKTSTFVEDRYLNELIGGSGDCAGSTQESGSCDDSDGPDFADRDLYFIK